MAKIYKTREEATLAVGKKLNTIINAYDKKKYPSVGKYVSKVDDKYTIIGEGEYRDHQLTKENDNIMFMMPWWESPMGLSEFNIGALRNLVDFLTDVTKKMKEEPDEVAF